MAFKTVCFSFWIFLVLFSVVKGSCLEYGHSCWGAHGKRSGNSKIYHTDDKAPIEFDFQDLNGLNVKNTYDSAEDQLGGSTDHLPTGHVLSKQLEDDEVVERPDKNSINFKNFLFKKLNKTNKKQHNLELPEYHMKKSDNMPAISERWRRLPLYNLRSVQMARPENEWLNELEQEQQINDNDYI